MRGDPARLLPVLYEAPTDPEQWMVFLNKVSEQVPSRVASLLVIEGNGKRCSLELQVGADPECQRQYQSYYSRIDAFYEYAKRKGLDRPGSIAPNQAYVSERDLLKTEFCNDFLLKFDIFHHCFALFSESNGAVGSLSLLRSPRENPFAEPELRLLRFLVPHVRRAIQLTEHFDQLRVESNAKQAALDQIGLGILFLDATGRVLGSNAAASALLERQNGISLSKGRLKAEHSSEDQSLQQAIWQAAQTGAGRAGGPGAGLLISRRPPAKPLQVVVGPACARETGLPSCPAAVVFVGDQSAPIRPRHELLKALYGLTPAESRVAFLLFDGKSSKEITALLRVSRNTLKTQIRNIFEKTDTRRQSQLIRLLTRLPVEHR